MSIKTWLQAVEGNGTLAAPRNLRVAAIMDTFTASSFQPECELLQLEPSTWFQQLQSFDADLLFVESAWLGKDGLWEGQIGHASQTLRELVAHARDAGIPAVFWNKEDPVKFELFLETASLFDVVFTTDASCVRRYKHALGHERCHWLPFAAQPARQNPIKTYEREDAFCFAGSYYSYYPERMADFEAIWEALREVKPFVIYDRNFGTDKPEYIFPDQYHEDIAGRLEFHEIDKAYKGYEYALNFNSVKYSQTMFARRVFELLASGTVVIGNFSRGVRNLFGDLTLCSDNPDTILSRLDGLVGDPAARQALQAAGVRKVMGEHVYQDRLAFVAAHAVGKSVPDLRPEVTLLGICGSAEEETVFRQIFASQTHSRLRLLLIKTKTYAGTRAKADSRIQIVEALSANALLEDLTTGASQRVCVLSSSNGYGPNYVSDLVAALRYTDAVAVCKADRPHSEPYSFSKGLRLDSGLVPLATLQAVGSLNRLRSTLASEDALEQPCFAVDSLEFGRSADGTSATSWHDLDTGLTLARIRSWSQAQLARPLLASPPSGEAQLTGAQCLSGLPTRAFCKASLVGEACQVHVDWGGAAGFFYMLARPVSLEVYGVPNGKVELSLDLHGETGSCQGVVYWLDEAGQRISGQVFGLRERCAVEVPRDCAAMQFGLRVSGQADFTVEAVSVVSQDAKTSIVEMSGETLLSVLQTDRAKGLSVERGDDTFHVQSSLEDGKHQYIYPSRRIGLDRFEVSNQRTLPVFLHASLGLKVQVVVFEFNADKARTHVHVLQPNKQHSVELAEDTVELGFGLRALSGGRVEILALHLQPLQINPVPLLPTADTLLITNIYPSYAQLYRNAFVHSRVEAYAQRGVRTDVFSLAGTNTLGFREFQGVDVAEGSERTLRATLRASRYARIAVHFLNKDLWRILRARAGETPIYIWIHGSDIQPWWRRPSAYGENVSEEDKARSERRMAFWRQVFVQAPEHVHFVFVSEWFARTSLSDLGVELPDHRWSVIHNPIDTELFRARDKTNAMRRRFLSIRPYASRVYANDLMVEAIRMLSDEPFFNDLSFHLVGDGPLFDAVTAPIADMPNVTLDRGFVTRKRIAALHAENGVFISPSRMDTHGVSRDEAMASGLVPIVSDVGAVSEFVDEDSGILTDPEQVEQLAAAIGWMAHDARAFHRLSAGASARVRAQAQSARMVDAELSLMGLP